MTIIPAIDILDGKVVRLRHGDYGQVTEYSLDPVDAAKELADLGAVRIHIVDLDAARTKPGTASARKDNRRVLEDIRKKVPVVLEVGGGIRTEADARELVDRGIQRLVLGTVFAQNPEIAAEWTETFGPVFLAGIDARDGQVKIAGWEEGGGISDMALAAEAARQGVVGIVYTNISQDGTLAGPDIGRTAEIARVSGLPVILSGGIGSDEHIRDVAKAAENHHTKRGGIVGVITGKAYYEGRIDLERLLKEFAQETGGW